MSEITTYSTASNARRVARKAGLVDFEIVEQGGRFSINSNKPALTKVEEAILTDWADVPAVDAEADVANGGTIEAMIEAAQAVQAEAVEAEVKGLAQTAAEVREQTLAMIREEDASVDAAKAWTMTFRFEAAGADKAEDMLAVYAKKLGFNVIAVGPQGREIFGLWSGKAKAVKAAKAAKPAGEAGAPKGKAAAMMAAAMLGVMPDEPDFSAATHKSYRPKLAKLVALAAAGDIAGLLAVEINPCSTSPKAMDRYRNAAVAALRFAADATKKAA